MPSAIQRGRRRNFRQELRIGTPLRAMACCVDRGDRYVCLRRGSNAGSATASMVRFRLRPAACQDVLGAPRWWVSSLDSRRYPSGRGVRFAADVGDENELRARCERPSSATPSIMDQTSITAAGAIDTFLVLLIGIGPKLALVPFLEITGLFSCPTPRHRRGRRRCKSHATGSGTAP